VAYAKIFATCNFMIACRRWNEKDPADKTWVNFKVHFAAARRQHKQLHGESAAKSGYHPANAAIGQTEDQMDEATIGSLANLATVTATDRGIVATLTEANSRLAKQLEERYNEMKEVKSILKKERAERKRQRTSNPSLENYFSSRGYKVAKIHTSQRCNYPKSRHNLEATKDNNIGGRQANKE
jgi:hypothetical protein